ncbi:MAG: thermonuclease family protein [Rhizobiaceae bacterium]|nr:thermonuclease family protein [Rhizobiaceae bacterium]
MGEPVGRQVLQKVLAPALALALSAFLVLAGGHMLSGKQPVDQPSSYDFAAEDLPPDFFDPQDGQQSEAVVAPQDTPLLPEVPDAPSIDSPVANAAEEAVATLPRSMEPGQTAASRMVEPSVVAPPELAGEELQREAPREPLSELGLALPPAPPETINTWAGKPLFRPVALESAVFQSGDHVIAISGVRSIPAEESCTYEGATWPCGVRARSAFRAWLRGRALVCRMPDEERDVTRARCRLAKQDVGAWLVSHGWAFADPDGPYVQAEEKAREAKMGIFAGPPDTSAVPDVPDAPTSTGIEMQPVMTEEGIDPQPSATVGGAFPPAPPPP